MEHVLEGETNNTNLFVDGSIMILDVTKNIRLRNEFHSENVRMYELHCFTRFS